MATTMIHSTAPNALKVPSRWYCCDPVSSFWKLKVPTYLSVKPPGASAKRVSDR